MAMTIDRLKELCEGESLKYFLAPDRPMVTMWFGSDSGRFQFVVPIELDGRFLQVRTVSYLSCPADHPHLDAVLTILGALNYQLRMTKFGWDPSDGEITAFADVWIEDGDLTQKQFGALIRSTLAAIVINHERLSNAIETGEDSGEIRPTGSPSKMTELAEKIAAAGSGDGDDEPDEDGEDGEDGEDKPLTV